MSNRAIDFQIRPAVFISVLGLLLILCTWTLWLQYQQSERTTAMEATIQNLQLQQFDRIAAIEATTQQQTEILSAALGNVLPVKMSPDWERRLEELEAKVADQSLWPGNTSQAKEFVDELSQLISELTPLSESNYFPRISLVRWAAVAFDALHRNPESGEPLDNLAEQIRAIADNTPEDIAPDLERRLRLTADNWANRAEAQLLEATIQQAQDFLTGIDAAGQETLATQASINEVYETLGFYETHPQRGEIIRSLRTKLQRHLTIREAQSRAAALTAQWANTKKLAASQTDVYETAASILLHEAASARAALVLQGIWQPIFDKLEGEIRDAMDARKDEAWRRYQKWALEEIIKFQKKHEAIADRASENARYFYPDSGGWNDERFREVQDAMVTYLLPINQALLDPPVLKRFHREFDSGWNRLDGRKEQTRVAEASARTSKRTLDILR